MDSSVDYSVQENSTGREHAEIVSRYQNHPTMNYQFLIGHNSSRLVKMSSTLNYTTPPIELDCLSEVAL